MTAAAATASLRPPAVGPGLGAWARALLSRVTLVLVPVEVPSARRAVEDGDLCRRKTLTEVDLNRNWPAAWRGASQRGAEEYGGAAPFSEPQSRALRDLARRLMPVAYANVHSGEWAIYVPWDHKKALAVGLPPDTTALVEALNTNCQARALTQPVCGVACPLMRSPSACAVHARRRRVGEQLPRFWNVHGLDVARCAAVAHGGGALLTPSPYSFPVAQSSK